jgi:hypothetical protein
MWEAIYYLIASLVVSAIFAPKSQSSGAQKPASFEDFDFPQSDEGLPQAVYFGECWAVSWMVLAVGDYRVTPITKTGGGKK